MIKIKEVFDLPRMDMEDLPASNFWGDLLERRRGRDRVELREVGSGEDRSLPSGGRTSRESELKLAKEHIKLDRYENIIHNWNPLD